MAPIISYCCYGTPTWVGSLNLLESDSQSLVEILRYRAENEGSKDAYLFLSQRGTREEKLSYAALDQRAKAIAAFLQSRGKPGERVLLFYPPGLEYISAFMGCLYAGMVAVPLYPPRPNQKLMRIGKVMVSCGAKIALTSAKMEPVVKQFLSLDPRFQTMEVHASNDLTDAASWKPFGPKRSELAFLQYTSGTTGTPKGVMVSHGNLLENERSIAEGFETRPDDICLSWLPFYHDMGLIGTVLHALYKGFTSILMSPLDFVRDPVGWLELITRYQATISGSPNFGYDLCVHRIDETRLAGLDLHRWRIAFNGAEPVRAFTLKRFARTFAPVGFSPNIFKPCYGMAEATLFISTDPPGIQPPTLTISKRGLEEHQAISSKEKDDIIPVVSNGMTRPDHQVRIVNPETCDALPEGSVGEIWFHGPSVAGGYWGREKDTKEIFQATINGEDPIPFLRTGDLGFLQAGRLYVTGRIKDLIIFRGRNYYPQDLELSAFTCHPHLRPSGSAAFTIPGDGEDEQLVLVQEIGRKYLADLKADEITAAIRQVISEHHQIQLSQVILVKPSTVPKTSSGKIQRKACRDLFLAGKIQNLATHPSAEEATTSTSKEHRQSDHPGNDKLQLLVGWIQGQLAKALKISPDQIDPEAPLTQLGVDSMMAIELEQRMENELGLTLSLPDLLNGQTLRQLASSSISHALKASRSNAAHQVDDQAVSRNQAALWFLHKLAPESGAYNISFCVKAVKGMDVERFKQAFAQLSERHPNLRSTFHEDDGVALRKIHENLPAEILVVDGRQWSQSRIDEHLSQGAAKPFHLEKGPLVRIELLRQEDDQYLLMFAMHHIIGDFWSVLVLMDELRQIYATPSQTLTVNHGAFQAYVAEQRQLLESPLGEQQGAYWAERLAGQLPILDLQTDRPRPALQTYEGASEAIVIKDSVAKRLRDLAQENQTTLYTVLLASYQIFLSQYTGQKDAVVGSPTFGRQGGPWKNAVGYFVNPVALRGDLQGNPTFLEYLQQARTRVSEALANSTFPFELLVERLQSERDPSRSPLFQTMFVLQKPHLLKEAAPFALHQPGARMNLGDLELESYPLQQRVSAFDLTLITVDTDDALVGQFEFNTDLFDRATIQRMTRHFAVLLEAIASHPTTAIDSLSLINPDEETRLLENLSGWSNNFPKDRCFHHIFELVAQAHPQAAALYFEGKTTTYDTLNRRANQLARHLQCLGVGSEKIVGICLERSDNVAVAMLATLKAGAAFLPLDPNYPAKRLAYMIEDAAMHVLISEAGIALQVDEVPRVNLDNALPTYEDHNLGSTCLPANRAYIIYTSGSTGIPKGVQLSHIGLANLITEQKRLFNCSPGKKVAQFSSLSFDASVWETVMALSSGACLYPVLQGLLGDDLVRFLAENHITHATLTPSVMAHLPAGSLPALEVAVAAGEACPPDLVGRNGKRFFNAYGPTEVTIAATIALCEKPGEKITIGQPLANVRIYLLDAHGNLVPEGIPGELCIGGPGLARGYQNRFGLTSERFVPNPFSQEPGQRLYRSGDLCRFTPAGQLEFLGRIDHQVKVRGFRIELGEIENLLADHPAVIQAAVVVQRDNLAAFVVPSSTEEPAQLQAQLRTYLQHQIPAYMVPTNIAFLEALPLTPSGKVNARALPEIEALLEGPSFVAPKTTLEKQVAAVWCDVLGVDQVGLGDNFFVRGGHSLIATQVVSRIRQSLAIDVPLKQLFLHPTLQAFCKAVAQADAEHAKSKLPDLEKAPADAPLSLSFSQERMWFLSQLEGPTATYNMPAMVQLQGDLNVAALKRSLNAILRRHQTLRTNVIEEDGKPKLVIREFESISLPIIKCTDSDEIANYAERHAVVPFNLAKDPLLRVSLIKYAANHHVLMVNLHHIIADGWSIGVLIRELGACYTAFSQGTPLPLNELPVQYSDFAHWHRQLLASEVITAQLDYWKQQLDGAPTLLELPTDRPRSKVRDAHGQVFHFEISPAQTLAVETAAKRHGVTLFQYLQAAFAILLHRYSRQKDILVGTPIAQRNHMDLEPLIGFFANTSVLRNRFEGDPSFVDFLKQVEKTTLAAYMHQDVPFDRLVDMLQPERDTRTTPLFQVMFSLQNAPLEALKLPKLKIKLNEVNPPTSRFDLTLSLQPVGGILKGTWEYATALFDEATLARLTRHFVNLLEASLTSPHQTISQLAITSVEEQHQLGAVWNQTQTSRALDICVHERIEFAAAQYAKAPSLIYGEASIDFETLNQRANQLAHFLRDNHLELEQPVAVLMKRTPEMVIAMLAILKAGGVYIPLDVNLPRNRFEKMLPPQCLVLTEQELVARLPEDARPLILFENQTSIGDQPKSNPTSRATPDHLAYIIFTSGSTGTPKGIAISHRNFGHYLTWTLETYQIARGESHPLHGSLAFDGNNAFLWTPLLAGKPTVLIPEEDELEQLVAHLAQPSANRVARFTPAHLDAIQRLAPEDMTWHIQRLVIGGDTLSGDRLAYWREKVPQAILVNEYGPSEITVGCCHFASSVAQAPKGPVPIGQAHFDTQLYVLEPSGILAPLGVPGELFIGGAGVGRGYFGRPDLTADRFVPNPFSDEPGSRLYRSGDLVRRKQDGNLVFMGRIDQQVKLRGFRIELGDIEAVLGAQPQITEAAVILHNDRLVAFFTPATEAPISKQDLMTTLLGELPEYMVPAVFSQLDAMPLNNSGKTDRKALSQLASHASEQKSEFSPPQTPMETFLAGLYAELLDLETVSRDAHFFNQGGHSLLATQLVSRIRQEQKIALPLREIFAQPRLSQLAKTISSYAAQHADDVIPAIVPRPSDAPLLLTSGQERLWFLFQLEGPNPSYNLPAALRLRGELNRVALQNSLDLLVQRHDVLRMNFTESDGIAQPIIHEDRTFSLTQVGAQGADQASLENAIRTEAALPFDLAHDPLVRGQLITIAQDDHLLLLTMHHIVADGWSRDIFVREWRQAYLACLNDKPLQLPELSLHMPDVAHWQRHALAPHLEHEKAYWQHALAGAPTFLQLPTDRPRPPRQTSHGDLFHMDLNPTTVKAVDALALKHGATRFMVLEAAFAALLHRYSGQDDLLIGFPIAGRNRAELEPLVGFLVNTLVLRHRFDATTRFNDLVATTKEETLEAFAHQNLPFEQVVDLVQPERAADHSPLFQAMFMLQNLQQETMTLADLDIEVCPRSDRVAHFDLTLCLEENNAAIGGFFEYNTDLFDRETIAKMATHFQELTQGLLEQPDLPIAQHALLNAEAKQQVIATWQGPVSKSKTSAGYHLRFEHMVTQHGEATALVWGREPQALTYNQLQERSEHFAKHLVASGVHPGDFVAVCLNRHAGLVIALLAIQKAGAAYVPLDPAYPQERIRFILSDSRPAAIISEPGLEQLSAGIDLKRLEIASDGSSAESTSSPNLPELPSGLLSHVIYTSGSTGVPKGVALARSGVSSLITWSQAHYSQEDLQGVLAATSICFDLSVFEIMVTLCRGGKVILVENVLDLENHPAANQVRLINTVPSAISELHHLGAIPKGLACINLAGEPLHRSLVNDLYALPQIKRVFNLYGPSEDTTYSTGAWIASQETGDPIIGRPLDNTKAAVLDVFGEPVPLGLIGELYLGGDSLAHGYVGRPALTAASFVPDPFADVAGARLYRTGDLVRFLPNEAEMPLAFLGRRDRQVKLRGFRIELDEIEASLTSHDACREAAVVVHGPQQDRLVAWVTPATNDSDDTAEVLRSYLNQTLPAHMVPAFILALDALPQLPNGKIDRKQLAIRPLPETLRSETFVPPRSEVEQNLASIWCDVLGVSQVGVRDNFFELGGHSLLATQLVSRIRNQFELELPLHEIFAAPTLETQAKFLESHSSETTSLAPIPVRPDHTSIPLTAGQERLWFLFQFEGPNPSYNLPAALQLHGNLNLDALTASLNHIIARHQVLQVNFTDTKGVPEVRIHPKRTFPLKRVDAKAFNSQAIEALMQEEAALPFDLAHDSLIRGQLIQQDSEKHLLLITMHHIVADGWSVGIFIRELSQCYQAFSTGNQPQLPALAIQVADVAHWQRAVQEPQLEKEKTYWNQQLSDAPTFLPLPTDRPRPPIQSSNGALHHITLPASLIQAVDSLANSRGITRFMILEAAFAVLLQRYSGQSDMLIGFPSAGRNRQEVEPLIGFFVNTLVLRNRIHSKASFNQLTDDVKQQTLDAFANQSLPFEQIVDMIQPERTADHSPLFQVMFILQNFSHASLELPGLEIDICPRIDRVAHFDLTLCLEEAPVGISGYFEYNADLFDARTIEVMADRYQTLLAGLLAEPNQAIGRVSFLDEAEQAELHQGWHGPQLDMPRDDNYHRLFEAEAEAQPEKTALVWSRNAHSLTFAELNQRAEHLALLLLDQGVRQGDLVAICLARHAGLIVAMLAVQKIGAAYVPLDPAYPADRIAFILEDAQPKVVVSQEELRDILTLGVLPCLELSTQGLCHKQVAQRDLPALCQGLRSHLIYTSGSTGKPKGVTITRAGVSGLIAWSHAWFDDADLNGVLAATSVCFDLSIFEIMLTLCRGGKIILVENVLDLLDHPAANQVRLINTVPSAMTELLHLDAVPEHAATINLAGEPLYRSLADDLYAQPQIKRVFNLYGPSEDTTYSTVELVPSDSRLEPLIGKPLALTKALVLDPLGQPVAPGLTGELFLGGAGLAHGYHLRPGLTAASFLPDPFAKEPGARLYRTGDLVRATPTEDAATLAFLGRRDRQVKLRGFRIELDEIEACLTTHPQCREAAVVIHKNQGGRLVAYVTGDLDVEQELGEKLRFFAGMKLPTHMVPTHIGVMPQLPQLPNGKIDRNRLARIPLPRIALPAVEHVAPRTDIERDIAAMWHEVLGVEDVGIHDNFFDLGGHSLLATRIIAQIRDHFGTQLPVARLFEDPTIAGLAKLIDTMRWAASEPVMANVSDDFEDGEI